MVACRCKKHLRGSKRGKRWKQSHDTRLCSSIETNCRVRFVKDPERRTCTKLVRFQVREFVKTSGVRYPTVLVNDEEGELREVMTSLDLAACKGDAQSFLSKLRESGILQQKQTSASL